MARRRGAWRARGEIPWTHRRCGDTVGRMEGGYPRNAWSRVCDLAEALGVSEGELRSAIHKTRRERPARLFPEDHRESDDSFVHGIEVDEVFRRVAAEQVASAQASARAAARRHRDRAERAAAEKAAARAQQLDSGAVFDELRRRYRKLLDLLPKQNYWDDT